MPGKLTGCTRENTTETQIFLVEDDSAGGSAKQARNIEIFDRRANEFISPAHE